MQVAHGHVGQVAPQQRRVAQRPGRRHPDLPDLGQVPGPAAGVQAQGHPARQERGLAQQPGLERRAGRRDQIVLLPHEPAVGRVGVGEPDEGVGRLGGYIASLAADATGTDLVALGCRIALGQHVERVCPRPGRVHFQYRTAAPREARSLLGVSGQRALDGLPGVDGYRLDAPFPVRLPETGTFHFDTLTGHADTHEEMTTLLRRAQELLRCRYDLA
jgi:hypothetical protein